MIDIEYNNEIKDLLKEELFKDLSEKACFLVERSDSSD